MTEVKSGLSLPGLPWRPDWAKESEAQRVYLGSSMNWAKVPMQVG